MESKGKINGLGPSGQGISSRATGYYGNRMKATSTEKRNRSAYLIKRYGKPSALIFLVAVSVLIGSSLLVAPSDPGRPADAKQVIPPPVGFIIGGWTYDEFGAKLPNCDVTITLVKTGDYDVVSSGTISFYSYIPAWPQLSVGDEIRVTAVKGVMTNTSTGIVPYAPMLQLDVKLDVLIPEFPMVIVPVMGMIALVAVVSLRRRGEEQ